MPEHHRCKARSNGVGIELRNVVQNKEAMPANLDKLAHGQRRCPVAMIDVPTNHMSGCDVFKPIDQLRLTDVAGVNDQVRPAVRVEGFGSQQPVGIRNDADNNARAGISCTDWHRLGAFDEYVARGTPGCRWNGGCYVLTQVSVPCDPRSVRRDHFPESEPS